MRLIKHIFLILSLFPLLSFASSHSYRMDATYEKISPACYRMFKTMFGFLPEFAETKGFGISNVKTPNANPSIYSFEVDYTPSGLGVGHYGLYQKYTDKQKELYLRLEKHAPTFPVEQIDDLWLMIGKALDTCAIIAE